MSPEDDSPASEQPQDIGSREQDPRVAAGRPTPAAAPRAGVTLTGFLGDSDRDGYRRLYFDRGLRNFVEFAVADVAEHSEVPADSPPFIGDRATRVTLHPGAQFEFTRTRTLTADEFALEPPIGRRTGIADAPDASEMCYGSRFIWCRGFTDDTVTSTEMCYGSRYIWCPW